MKIIITALIGLLPLVVFAKEDGKLWVNHGFVSYHFDREQGFNEVNHGFGLEYTINQDVSLAAGRFRNSERHTSNYFTVAYQPFHYGNFKFGITGGTINGYKGFDGTEEGGYVPLVAPAITYEKNNLGLNILIIPDVKIGEQKIYGTVGFQFKIRVN